MYIYMYINDIKIKIEKNSTVLQACMQLKKDIPKFCYQDNLKIAGNCRMCLIEIKGSLKPVASCSLPVSKDLKVYTNTPLVKKAREAVLEFLLLNHPLDCPICDQGGECDLQDHTLVYGSDRSRFFELKKTVEDKDCGPFVKTIMTRCIHCTRCVRFSNDICGIDEIGSIGRGRNTEISFYLQKMFTSEFSGNVIDLCPVGAFRTGKPTIFSFKNGKGNINLMELSNYICSFKILTFNDTIIFSNTVPEKYLFKIPPHLLLSYLHKIILGLDISFNIVAVIANWDIQFYVVSRIITTIKDNVITIDRTGGVEESILQRTCPIIGKTRKVINEDKIIDLENPFINQIGALTNKPFSFKVRSWELKNRYSIDILDSIGSNIKINIFNKNIIRILPVINDEINIEWISNKTRFFFDSLNYQRLKYPMIKKKYFFLTITWQEALNIFLQKIIHKDPSKIKMIIGNLVDLKSIFLQKKQLNLIGINNIKYQTKYTNILLNNNLINTNFFTKNVYNFENIDLCLLVNCDPLKEISILNLHFRKNLKKNMKIYNIGENLELTYPCINLGNSNEILISIIEGKHFFCKKILSSKKTMIIFGQKFLNNKFNKKLTPYLTKKNIICNNLFREVGFLNFIETTFEPKYKTKEDLLLLYNTDLNFSEKKKPNKFIIYQGHHFTSDALASDLLLPIPIYLEKNSIFFNLKGVINKIKKVINSNSIFSLRILYIFLCKKNMKNFIYKKCTLLYTLPYLKRELSYSQKKLINIYNSYLKINLNILKPLLNKNYNTNILEKYSRNIIKSYILLNSKKNFK